jgi:hypothetical protein
MTRSASVEDRIVGTADNLAAAIPMSVIVVRSPVLPHVLRETVNHYHRIVPALPFVSPSTAGVVNQGPPPGERQRR